MLAVTWFKPKHLSGFVSTYAGKCINSPESFKELIFILKKIAVNLGYAVVGLIGTPLVRYLGRDSLSYAIAISASLWYFLWWRFVEETLNPNRPKRDVSLNKQTLT